MEPVGLWQTEAWLLNGSRTDSPTPGPGTEAALNSTRLYGKNPLANRTVLVGGAGACRDALRMEAGQATLLLSLCLVTADGAPPPDPTGTPFHVLTLCLAKAGGNHLPLFPFPFSFLQRCQLWAPSLCSPCPVPERHCLPEGSFSTCPGPQFASQGVPLDCFAFLGPAGLDQSGRQFLAGSRLQGTAQTADTYLLVSELRPPWPASGLAHIRRLRSYP